MFLILGIGLYFVFIKDPCNNQVRTDFLNRFPGYEILDHGPSEGSRETVRCHISYRKPDSEEVYEDIWLYQDSGRGWEFSKILESRKQTGPGGDPGDRPRSDDPAASPSL
ncbi:MAG: hypothetical protein JRG83_12175 [Deltaproteobacteria bacterium]|nr:hypothetical protein [Deltaproteobacteria bacterium]